MTDHVTAALSQQLATKAAGYLRNTIREPRVTCSVCTTPVDGYKSCFRCRQHAEEAGVQLADATAFLFYGVSTHQSGYMMYGYKGEPYAQEPREVVTLSVIVAERKHSKCASELVGAKITHWVTVPSLKGRTGEHPLRALAGPFAPGTEVAVAPATASTPRALSADHFIARGRIPAGSHVLVIDDTWVTGGHAQSLALSLRHSGASYVSILAMARWIVPSYGGNAAFIKQRLISPYRPDLCPWTGTTCPDPSGAAGKTTLQ